MGTPLVGTQRLPCLPAGLRSMRAGRIPVLDVIHGHVVDEDCHRSEAAE